MCNNEQNRYGELAFIMVRQLALGQESCLVYPEQDHRMKRLFVSNNFEIQLTLLDQLREDTVDEKV